MTTILGALSVGVLIGLAFFWAHIRWARWAVGGPRAPRWTRFVPGVIVTGWVLGVAWTLYGVAQMFTDAEGPDITDPDLDAHDRALILAKGFSEMMNGSVFIILWWILCGLVLVVLSWRYRWSAAARAPRETTPESAPREPTPDKASRDTMPDKAPRESTPENVPPENTPPDPAPENVPSDSRPET